MLSELSTMSDLLHTFALFGVDITPVEGWEEREAFDEAPFEPIGVMIHHTASDNTSLNTILNGNGTVPGPLSQWFIEDTPSDIAHLVAAGRCNHAGLGDTGQVDRMLAGVPPAPDPGPDDGGGNFYFYGLELEGDDVTDFDRAGFVYDQGVRVTAAYCWWHDWDPFVRVIGHKEWTRRKIDPAFDMDVFRQDVRELMDMVHQHAITTENAPRVWADEPWEWYVDQGFSSVPESRAWEALREDLAWVTKRIHDSYVVSLESAVSALTDRVATLETTVGDLTARLEALEPNAPIPSRFLPLSQADAADRKSDVAYLARLVRTAYDLSSAEIPADGTWPDTMVAALEEHVGPNGSQITGNEFGTIMLDAIKALAVPGPEGPQGPEGPAGPPGPESVAEERVVDLEAAVARNTADLDVIRSLGEGP